MRLDKMPPNIKVPHDILVTVAMSRRSRVLQFALTQAFSLQKSSFAKRPSIGHAGRERVLKVSLF
jgi:hypothetical protein